VHPLTLQASLPLPAGHRSFVEGEGGDDGLHRTAVGHQRHYCHHQPLRFVHAVEGGVFGGGEGPAAALAAVAALFLAMAHDMPLADTAVGATVGVVAPLLMRVHAVHPLSGG
jgi:hypothetical protein